MGYSVAGHENLGRKEEPGLTYESRDASLQEYYMPTKARATSIVTKYVTGMFSHFALTLGGPSIQNIYLGFPPLFHYLCLLPDIGG